MKRRNETGDDKMKRKKWIRKASKERKGGIMEGMHKK